jgi:endonuclease I
LVEGIGAKRRHHKVSSELVLGIDDNCLNSAASERPLADVFHVFAALADINGKRDNLFTGRVLQPANAYGCVEATGIR